VRLSGSLKTQAGGRERVEVEGRNIREILDSLAERCPELQPLIARGVAVAINGEIYRDAWFQPISSDSEVYILPKMAGG
jgi:sulfur-carrier protein